MMASMCVFELQHNQIEELRVLAHTQERTNAPIQNAFHHVASQAVWIDIAKIK